MNALLVYPEFPDTFWSFKHALKFINKKSSSPPLGLLTVASLLPRDWTLKLVDLNVSSLTQSDIKWADIALISAMVVQRESAHEVIHLLHDNQVKVIAGGPLFIGEHENFPEVDHFVLNEAEITLPEFIQDLRSGNPKPIYSSNEFSDIQTTPMPKWELAQIKKYDSLSIQYSRGCPFNCEFCNVTTLFGHTPRVKTTRQIIDELNHIYDLGWRRNIFFVDDNFIGNKRILKSDLLPALIQWREGKVGCTFITEASINLADDDELIDLMVRAGFRSVFIGIETPDDDSLKECNKFHNRKRDLVQDVIKLHHKGLQVMGGFIVGFDNDNQTIFQRQIDFIQNSGIVTAMVGLLQAPFGTRLYNRLLHQGRILAEISGDNSDGTTNIIPVMDITTLKQGYQDIIAKIYSPKLFYQRVMKFLADYKPARIPGIIARDEISAFFRSIFQIGFHGSGWIYYWKLFFWSLVKYPKKFPLAITMAIYGYHFRIISGVNQ